MAQVARDSELQNRIEEFLTYLTNEWEAIPTIVSEWDSWDEHSRMAFVLDWPIREDRLAEIERYA
ncbi:MAG TPA: hypothetical protein VMW65_18205, partial [Chloroflexota bacterium]|nr:hypothetical protein [Chloroflexota bacterium]